MPDARRTLEPSANRLEPVRIAWAVRRLPTRALFVLAVLNLPLLAEVIRKYVIQSNAVLFVVEFLLVLCALTAFLARPSRVILPLLFWALAIAAWSLATVAMGHQNLMLGLVGIRSVVVPVAVLVLSFYLFRTAAPAQAGRILYGLATVWLLAIGVIAVLQLALGRDHAINQIAPHMADERAGIGDYTAGDLGLEFLFRPTSIFLHTAKFGQVGFVLACFCLFYRGAVGGAQWWSALRTLFELGVLLISGQRAAMLAYAIAFVFLHAVIVRSVRLWMTLLLSVALGAAVLSANPALGDFVGLIRARFWSGVTDVPVRLASNVLAPTAAVAANFGIAGAGAGAFSLGSSHWGGRPLYDVIYVGTAENSWLRIWAELGIPGLMLWAVLLGGLLILAATCLLRLRRTEVADARLISSLYGFNLFQFAVLALWANTHDVLGSVTTMAVVFSYSGIVLLSPLLIRTDRPVSAMKAKPTPMGDAC